TVTLWIPLEELIKRGILTLNEENGKTYWYLYGEKLDPKTYENIYRRDQRTFRTLLEELGIREFMDKFDDITIPPHFDTRLLIFFYKNFYFDIRYHHKDHPTPTLYARYILSDIKKNLKPDIEVSFNVNNPKIEDVYMFEELLKKLESDIELKVSKIISWIESNTKYQLTKKNINVGVSGTIHIKDYYFDTYSLLITTRYDIDDRSDCNIYINYFGNKVSNNFNVIIEYSIRSKYLVDAIETIGVDTIELENNKKTYNIITNKLNKHILFRSSEWYTVDSELKDLPDISEEINIIMNTKNILYNIINEGLNNMKEEPIFFCNNKLIISRSLGIKVGDLMKIIDWNENQTPEEAVLKINLAKLYLNNKETKPDILSVFISLAYLGGASYDYVLEKVNEGLDYVIELARRGRLKITENGIYLDGKKIKFDTNNNFVKSIMELVFILSSEENIGTDISISEKISI
ncbi:MAG: hypothetical protein QW456_11905, partial [Ignisphaera sp.]